MPTLFISYKRGTSAVAPLMERLQAGHYRLWFDRDEIHLGDPDWKARIDQGIEHCDGLILCLTSAACASEPVQYEVKKAQELGKPIFPIVLEKIEDWSAALTQVGLTPSQHTEDFTDVTKWDEQIKRLLRDLEIQGLRVTRHDRRQQRDRNNPNYVHHQTYLKRLAERIGILNLAQINPDNAQGIELERVYVDSPTGLSISVEVQNWQVVRWWVDVQRQFGKDEDDFATIQYQPEDTIFERAALETLLGQVDDRISKYRQKYPDEKPDEGRNSWKNGIHENALNLHLNHLAAARDRLVILGAPGSGKSTFVKYLALCLAGAGIDDWTRQVDITSLDNWSHGALTPIYVELRRFVASKHFPSDVKTPVTADHLWAYICADILGDSLHAYAEDLRYDLEHGHAVLILDGLDEVPYPEGKLKERQNQLISLASSLNTRYATSRVMVASRPYAYEGWKLPEFEAITITDFSDNHRIDLAKRLYQVAGLNDESAHEKAQALNQQLRKIDPELKDRPLFVTLMATIYLKGEKEGLPTRRGALYRESILLLLDRWTQGKANAPSLQELLGTASKDDLYNRLAQLAYEVHMKYGEQKGAPEIPNMLLESHLMKLGRKAGADPVGLYAYLSENAGVLVSPGQDDEKDVFHFAHRTFQEYLAGEHMVSLCVEADSFQLVRNHIMEKPQIWRIPCTLAGDVLADTERRGDLWDLLDDLLDDEIENHIAADDPRWWSVWLASMVVKEQKMLGNEKLKRRDQVIADQLRDWILELIKTPFALGDTERNKMGRILSELGDSREGVGTRTVTIDRKPVEIPDIEWVTIPAGEFSYGDKSEDNGPQKMTLPTFQIARYPLTYAQFQTFLNDREGYPDKERWLEGLHEDAKKVEMAEQEFKYSNHPRENVNWYQAIAFCRWLSWRLGSDYALDTIDQWAVRLPTEFEWEKAARANTGWAYPYGDEFDISKSNTSLKGIIQTSVVGIFPAGDTPHWDKPIADLSGNVWEWCLTDSENPQIKTVDENISSNKRRVVRGSSWGFSSYDTRTVYRSFSDPFYRSLSYGFRLCCPLSL